MHDAWYNPFSLNSLRPKPNRRHFADDIFKRIFENENEWISPRISLKFVPDVRINNIPALVQILAWRRPGDKPLSEPMMVSFLTHICVTRSQWVKLVHWFLMARCLVGDTTSATSVMTYHASGYPSVTMATMGNGITVNPYIRKDGLYFETKPCSLHVTSRVPSRGPYWRSCWTILHDDVIKWKHFPRNWPFVRGIHRPRWIPHTKASDAELWCFLWSASE